MKRMVWITETAAFIAILILTGVVYLHQWFSETQELDEYIASSPYRMFYSYADPSRKEPDYEKMELFPDKGWWIESPGLFDFGNSKKVSISIFDKDGKVLYEDIPLDLSKEATNDFRRNTKEYYTDFSNLSREDPEQTSILSESQNWHGTATYVPIVNQEQKHVFVFLVYENVRSVALFRTLPYMLAIFAILELFAGIVLTLFRRYFMKKQELEQQRQMFLHAISHEIKTPSAIIKSAAETLAEVQDGEQRATFVQMISEEVDHVDQLVNSMLVYTETSEKGPVRKDALEGKALIENSLKKYASLIEKKNISLEIGAEEHMNLRVDPKLFPYVLDNLVSNAVAHCDSGGIIRIEIEEKRLSVFNSGSWIPEEALPHLWEPLFMVEKDRNGETNSSGMGLAICANILDLHGATYQCRNVPGGVLFEILFENE